MRRNGLHKICKKTAGLFLAVLSDMEVYLFSGFIICLADSVHDFMEPHTSLSQERNVGMAENVGRYPYVGRKVSQSRQPIYAYLYGFLRAWIAVAVNRRENKIISRMPVVGPAHFFEEVLTPPAFQSSDNHIRDIDYSVACCGFGRKQSIVIGPVIRNIECFPEQPAPQRQQAGRRAWS